MTVLKVFRKHETVELPKFATEQSACFDLAYSNAGKDQYDGFNHNNKPFTRYFTDDSLHIGPGDRVLVPTGIIFDIPVGYSVRVHNRSGTALKQGLVLVNAEGVIDSDYILETFLLMVNTSEVGITLHNGDRLAQAELIKSEQYSIELTTEQPEIKTSRIGGMGSTGVGKIYSVDVSCIPSEQIEESIKKSLKKHTAKKVKAE